MTTNISSIAFSDKGISPELSEIINANCMKEGSLLPVLHAVQNLKGYIPQEWVAAIAKGLNLSRAEVHGVITFYTHFYTKKPANHRIQVCRAESCQAMGSRQLESAVKERLGIDYEQHSDDNQFELEEVYCLGNCACSPSIMIDDKLYGRVNAARFNQLMDNLGV